MKFDMPLGPTWEFQGGWLVRRYSRDLSLLQFQAAGLVGNFGAETEGFRYMQEIGPRSGRGGLGWAQWTGPRREAFEAFCAENLWLPTNPQANYNFSLVELNGPYKRVLVRLRACNTLEVATRIIHNEYETPQDVLDKTYTSFGKRLDYAQRALRGVKSVPKADAPPGKAEEARKTWQTASRRYQEHLQALGLYTGEIDGLFGPESWTAHLAYRKLFHGDD